MVPIAVAASTTGRTRSSAMSGPPPGRPWPKAVSFTDTSAAARPGLDHPVARAVVEAVGGEPKPKYGWTDVARFSALGVPAVNFSAGSALLAHTDDEHVSASQIRDCYTALNRWLVRVGT